MNTLFHLASIPIRLPLLLGLLGFTLFNTGCMTHTKASFVRKIYQKHAKAHPEVSFKIYRRYTTLLGNKLFFDRVTSEGWIEGGMRDADGTSIEVLGMFDNNRLFLFRPNALTPGSTSRLGVKEMRAYLVKKTRPSRTTRVSVARFRVYEDSMKVDGVITKYWKAGNQPFSSNWNVKHIGNNPIWSADGTQTILMSQNKGHERKSRAEQEKRTPAKKHSSTSTALNSRRARLRDRSVLAVFDIQDTRSGKHRFSRQALGELGGYLNSLLAETRRFTTVPRSDLRKALASEKARSYQACFDESCQIEIGKEVAAEKSLATKISRIGKKCVISMMVYDLRRSTSDEAVNLRGGCDHEAIIQALEKLVPRLGSNR